MLQIWPRNPPKNVRTSHSAVWLGKSLERKELGYLEKGIQTPMAQGRSTKIISMIRWIRTSRLSIKKSLSGLRRVLAHLDGGDDKIVEEDDDHGTYKTVTARFWPWLPGQSLENLLVVLTSLGMQILGYLEKEIQPPLAQGRSTNTISMIEWIRTSRLSIKYSLSLASSLGP